MRAVNSPADVHLLGFQGAENFRDLGGYKTRDGRTIRWKRLFRSGHLSELTEFDLQQLASLSITGRVDLRSLAERETMPTRWPDSLETKVHTIDVYTGEDHPVRGLFGDIMRGEVSLDAARSRMLEDYRNMPVDYARIISELMLLLAENSRGAVLVHCTAGKDRTGFVIALLLDILQVPRKVVLQDYLLSNRGFDAEAKIQQIKARHLNKVEDIEAKLAVLRLLLRVEAGYLIESLHSIDRQFGGVSNYLEQHLGVTSELTQQVRHNLLSA